MSEIFITFKDGSTQAFKRETRTGGSYSKRLEFEVGFAVVIDEYARRIAYPSSDIKQIIEIPDRY